MPRPTPRPTPLTQPYWDALAESRLELPRCTSCDRLVFYPRLRCPYCGGDEFRWEPVEARGRLVTFTTTSQPTAPPFADEMPQRIAIVELDAGVRLSTTLVDVDDAGELGQGTEVEGRFVRGADGVTMLHFAPISS